MRVVTFGELMLRLSTPKGERVLQSPSFDATFGGGEANVSVSIANYGMDAAFVTKLPSNDIAYAAVKELKGLNVDTNNIVYGDGRMGIYYLESGMGVRPSKVIYDRSYSSISMATTKDFNFKKIFKGANWFHFTGITPALSKNAYKITLDACKIAKSLGLKVSCDLNYRSKLWSKEEANQAMTSLMPYVDLLICNESDASDVFGIKLNKSNITSGEIDKDEYEKIAREIENRFNIHSVAITLRESINASINNWSAMLYTNNKAYFSKKYTLNILDRVGGGDSFAGGLIYSLLSGDDASDSLEFAVAASELKHTIFGDYNRVTKEEVLKLKNGDGSGRVVR